MQRHAILDDAVETEPRLLLGEIQGRQYGTVTRTEYYHDHVRRYPAVADSLAGQFPLGEEQSSATTLRRRETISRGADRLNGARNVLNLAAPNPVTPAD